MSAKIIPLYPPKKELDVVESLRENLRKLDELHQRLRYMLSELQELIPEEDRE